MNKELEQLNKTKNAFNAFIDCFYKNNDYLSLKQHNKVMKYLKEIDKILDSEKEKQIALEILEEVHEDKDFAKKKLSRMSEKEIKSLVGYYLHGHSEYDD